jgi:polar amino acid transport system permease protein
LIVISLWYLAMTTVLSIGQYFIERHYRRGIAGGKPDRFLAVWSRNLYRWRGRSRFRNVPLPMEPTPGGYR